ncbi:MAG: FxsB family radical SAM/SPASM domain protein [Mycobacteriaceae bacterium]|nr:FxsB family radical SAM/SPASM domain protein [Mycobacteriaceae bacterium]
MAAVEQPKYETLWPTAGLDTERLLRGGWRPSPFVEFVVKVHSRCNLACDYCYMYEMADQSWRDRPTSMRDNTFEEACRTIGAHARTFSLTTIALVFHGGEPLLVGHRALDRFAERARDLLEPIAEVRLGMQTNGVLLDEEFLRICDRRGIRVGVSVDGDRDAHDRHRTYRRGSGSYGDVAQGLALLADAGYRHLYSGLLCTIDVANDPVDTYEALLRFAPPAVDLLLPHGNWAAPPPNHGCGGATPYGDWLVAVFDRWYDAPTLETRVRLFDDILTLLLGGRANSESVGLEPVRVAVIETDGALEQVDTLKSAFAGATRLAVPADGNPLDAALRDPSIVARQIGIEALSDTCVRCRIHKVCGGGNYTHRYRADSGFRNPSVYCADLQRLINHIETRLRGELERIRDGKKGTPVDD